MMFGLRALLCDDAWLGVLLCECLVRLMLMMLACRLWNGEWTQEGRLMDLMLALTPRNRHQWPRERRLMLMMLACRLRNRCERTQEGRLMLVMLALRP